MAPLDHFDRVWGRCELLAILHHHSVEAFAAVLDASELLRAEWVARVSALDLYVHELIAQRMVAIFEGRNPQCPAYSKFSISNEALSRIRAAATPQDAGAAFDLEVRQRLSRHTYQLPEAISDGVKLCGVEDLWNEVALRLGATERTKTEKAAEVKRGLSLIVRRRNLIAHEGDLGPPAPREPNSIAAADISIVRAQIETVVRAIDAVARRA